VTFEPSRLTKVVPSTLLDRLTPKKLFSRLDIASKLLLGYLVLVVATIIIAIYALISLQRLNSLNSSIVKVDVPVQDSANKMLEAIIAQDTYERRYLILNDPSIRNLSEKRADEFRQLYSAIKNLPHTQQFPLAEIGALYQEYDNLTAKQHRLIKAERRNEASRLSNGPLKKTAEHIIDKLRSMEMSARQAQQSKMQRISFTGKVSFFVIAVLSLLGILLGIIGSLVVTNHISSSLTELQVATQHIAEGNFDYEPRITDRDEIGHLATAFVDMGKRLRKLEEMYLDASPLTRLPGGIAIENVMKKRIESKQLLAFCVFDLDNFKAFNDRYGYAHGSEVLKETARIIEDSVKARGTMDDFIGHIGGDDFVVITVPDRMRPICEEVIDRFDRRIPEFYDDTDRKTGYIFGKTRQGVEMKFPIMTISIAIVTNERRALSNPLEASEIAAELKDYAKTMPKSVFVIDKRRTA
jgi:GGDEF domain-containing protein/CHASE3 domain sensor protein